MKTSLHKIVYSKAPNSISAGIDGVHGGVAPQGKISANFFVETTDFPAESTIEVNEIGEVIKDHTPKAEMSSSHREIIASFNMDLAVAKSFHIWLGLKIEELERILVSPIK